MLQPRLKAEPFSREPIRACRVLQVRTRPRAVLEYVFNISPGEPVETCQFATGGKKANRRKPCLSGPPQALEAEPVKPRGFDDLVQDQGSGILKVDQGASSGIAASDHRICNPFTNFVTVLVGWNPLADLFESRRHIGDGVLIKFR
jgi:hypothetical protein